MVMGFDKNGSKEYNTNKMEQQIEQIQDVDAKLIITANCSLKIILVVVSS